jgi:hypothetical protein
MKTSTLAFSTATFLVLACVPVGAQQTTGTPGSPSATTTIDGKYLPPPRPRRSAARSTWTPKIPSRIGHRPWCRPRVHPTSS